MQDMMQDPALTQEQVRLLAVTRGGKEKGHEPTEIEIAYRAVRATMDDIAAAGDEVPDGIPQMAEAIRQAAIYDNQRSLLRGDLENDLRSARADNTRLKGALAEHELALVFAKQQAREWRHATLACAALAVMSIAVVAFTYYPLDTF